MRFDFLQSKSVDNAFKCVTTHGMQTLSLRLPEELIEKLNQVAKREGLKPTQIARVALVRAVNGMAETMIDVQSSSVREGDEEVGQ